MPFAPAIGDCQREEGGENLVMGRRLSGGLGLLSFSVLSGAMDGHCARKEVEGEGGGGRTGPMTSKARPTSPTGHMTRVGKRHTRGTLVSQKMFFVFF